MESRLWKRWAGAGRAEWKLSWVRGAFCHCCLSTSWAGWAGWPGPLCLSAWDSTIFIVWRRTCVSIATAKYRCLPVQHRGCSGKWDTPKRALRNGGKDFSIRWITLSIILYIHADFNHLTDRYGDTGMRKWKFLFYVQGSIYYRACL